MIKIPNPRPQVNNETNSVPVCKFSKQNQYLDFFDFRN
jgi:hypothetical protein